MINKKQIEEFKAELEAMPKNTTGARIIKDDFRKKIINYHYKSGKNLTRIANEINVSAPSLYGWKKIFGKERTVFIHGETVRNDLRTKALAVQEVLEFGKSKVETALKYGVADVTIGSWVKKMEHEYHDLLDSRDGIPYLVKEEKMVYGNENITAILQLKEKHVAELSEVMELMHKNGFTKQTVNEAKKKKAEAEKDIAILKEAKEVIKKTK